MRYQLVRADDNVFLLGSAKLPAPAVVIGTNIRFLRVPT